MTDITELFAIPTGDLKPAGGFAGKVFYTSSDLKRKYILAMMKSSKGSIISAKINELVKRGIITPVYKSKSIIRAIFKLQPIEFEGIAGAAFPSTNTVYIFVETGANMLSFNSNNAIASVTLHELLHLLSFTKGDLFFSTFKGDLEKFYKFYFCKLLSCNESKVDNSEFNKLINFLYWDVEKSKSFIIADKDFLIYHEHVYKAFKEATTLQPEHFNELLRTYFVALKLIQKMEGMGQGHNIIKIATTFKHIFSPFYVAYKYVFGIDALKENQFVFQEMFAPSEVISLQTLASSPSNKIYQALKKL